jgi:molecular chaperone GrpE
MTMPDDTSIPVDSPPAAPSELDTVRAKLDAAEQQLANYKLVVADYENARKRTARDAEVNKKYAAESFARDLLGALDNLDRALGAAKAAGDTGPLATGVAATAEQFLTTLRRHGVTRIECGPGTKFDENLHAAVMEQPSANVPPGHVVQVLQQGFMFHDRVLRPTSVIVASASS